MASEQQRLTPSERNNLVAYLDGELNEAEARAINTKLAHSATARREVELLEKTWELLDHLPRPKAPADFTARTLTQAEQLKLQRDVLHPTFRLWAWRFVKAVLSVAISLLAFGAGYAITRWVWPDETARLARDLPIAEHLDELRDVGTFQFLESVADTPGFSSGSP